MKKVKVLCAAVAMTAMAAGVMAQEPPEAVNVHWKTGDSTLYMFDEFDRMEFNGGAIEIVPGERIYIDDIRKITFGIYSPTVTFKSIGYGTVRAYVTDDGMREIQSGEKVETGQMILFSATPWVYSKIKGWWINNEYMDYDWNERYLTVEDEGLDVRVEFVRSGTGTESTTAKSLDIYVRGREIVIESNAEIIEGAKVFDTSGRLLHEEVSREATKQMVIPADGMSQGVYILLIHTTEGDESGKVLIK